MDLHAATAVRVMQRRLGGGDALVALHRCELHTVVGGAGRADAVGGRCWTIGRYFNPNKHHYGHFRLAGPRRPWTAGTRRRRCDAAWPGAAGGVVAAPLARPTCYDRLLGGAPAGRLRRRGRGGLPARRDRAGGRRACCGGWCSRTMAATRRALADRLAVARAGDQGLLVNPHLEGWLIARCAGP